MNRGERSSSDPKSPRLQIPLFRIGQTVSMSLGSLGRGKSISGKIVKLLPLEEIYYQYCVKCPAEAFERVANEHELIAERSVFEQTRRQIY